MRKPALARLLALSLGACAASIAFAQSAASTAPLRPDFGKREFENNCAACHGANGRGQGPLTDMLRKSPPDLTQLARRNQGVLPVSRLYEVIEGSTIAAHGSRDMPVWGHDYKLQAAEYYGELPYDPEAYVRARVLALIDYLGRLQAK
jgi:mono/diheme cytochrome c family protein